MPAGTASCPIPKDLEYAKFSDPIYVDSSDRNGNDRLSIGQQLVAHMV